MKRIAVVVLLLLCTCGCDINLDNSGKPELGIDLLANEVVYTSKDEVTGVEKYEITVYKLNEQSLFKFLRFDEKGEYPKHKTGFNTKMWEKAPLGTDETQVLDMLKSYDPLWTEWKEYRKKAEELFKGDKGFYSYYYKQNGSYITALQCYIIEPRTYTLIFFDYRY